MKSYDDKNPKFSGLTERLNRERGQKYTTENMKRIYQRRETTKSVFEKNQNKS